MKLKIYTNSIKFFLIMVILVITSLPVLAVTSDLDKPINVESEKQALDLQGNVATFTGNVIVTQGTIKITADKVLVTRPNGNSNKTIVDAYGNPATFYQMQDNGKPLHSHAAKLHYELAKDFIELIGNAYIEQLDSNITGDHITYLVKEQRMQAYGQGRNKRVTTVLMPSQIHEKNTNIQKKN
ncbi:lipopolysaccharide ABC transporter substrate-binding protein LptA [Pantoea sp. Nvir]|uniref:lipopolysaccharide ABC transporter substrate-binding protein LptA n=1 Tax=Pantoea sp. Nvir TaxID=2576760 RepID=UPI00135C9406|nr:lipopolysaccharide ABC transporter substrate-binding protein LptA [Pantoea sp. Nvir]MXP66447.1 lipopolysaccharide ABC transporter substrate-binding protein LptA [Pantoea sp. Nvir]CAJ0993354.1 Lipopolysaccharide export system protein LptA [Pantoea sp. Nvir]